MCEVICIHFSSQYVWPRFPIDFRVYRAQCVLPIDSSIRKPPHWCFSNSLWSKTSSLIILCIHRPMLLFLKQCYQKNKINCTICTSLRMSIFIIIRFDRCKNYCVKSCKFSKCLLTISLLLTCRLVAMCRPERVRGPTCKEIEKAE